MSRERGDWILASDAGLHNMYFGRLEEGKSASDALKQLAAAGGSAVSLELFDTRLVMHQSVPLVAADGNGLTIQTLFRIMPFPTNPDGAHVCLKATTIIDVEGDLATKELLMASLSECQRMEAAEKARRSKIASIPAIIPARS